MKERKKNTKKKTPITITSRERKIALSVLSLLKRRKRKVYQKLILSEKWDNNRERERESKKNFALFSSIDPIHLWRWMLLLTGCSVGGNCWRWMNRAEHNELSIYYMAVVVAGAWMGEFIELGVSLENGKLRSCNAIAYGLQNVLRKSCALYLNTILNKSSRFVFVL